LRPASDEKDWTIVKTVILTGVILGACILTGSAQAQDVAAGERSFKKCLPCHAIGPGAVNKVGPILNGLDGRKSGTVAGYSYSEANKGSGITWNKAEFLDYIKAPRAKIPNTKMTFAGITKASEAESLWAYLAQFNADGSKK
jgi:cytochrome c